MKKQRLELTQDTISELEKSYFELDSDVKCVSKRLNKYIALHEIKFKGIWYRLSEKDFSFLVRMYGIEITSPFSAIHNPK